LVTGVLATDELEHNLRAEDGGGAGLQHATETVADPAASLGRRFHHQALAAEIAHAETLEPDAVGGLVDSQGELGLHA
jgi:hypothetical protein